MSDEVQDLVNAGYKPVIVGPKPFSFDDLLRNVDPAPDEETERFVAAIYADRRQAAGQSPSTKKHQRYNDKYQRFPPWLQT